MAEASTSKKEEVPLVERNDVVEVGPLAILATITLITGRPLPKEKFTNHIVMAWISEASTSKPIAVTIVSDREIIIEYARGVLIIEQAQKLRLRKNWEDENIELTSIIASKKVLYSILRDREMGRSRLRKLEYDQKEMKVEQEKYRTEIKGLLERVNSKLGSLTGGLTEEGGSDTTLMPHDEPVSSPRNNKFTQPPKLPAFSGGEPIPKDEANFQQWRFQVRGVLSAYSPEAVKTSIINSVRGEARELVGFVGYSADVEEILDRMTERFARVTNIDRVKQEFYQCNQDKNEKVTQFAGRLEQRFQLLRDANPERFDDSELRGRFFYGIHQTLRDSIRFLFERPSCSYVQLLKATREAELESQEGNCVILKKELVELVEPQKHRSFEEIKEKLDNLASIVKTTILGKKGNDVEKRERQNKPLRCYKCGGWGHISKGCPTSGNVDWRTLSGVRPPPEIKGTPSPQ